MPAFESIPSDAAEGSGDPLTRFPPPTRDHILHCSYDSWFPRYRSSCIQSRIIKLSPEFVDYLSEDGIMLADDGTDGDENEGEDDDDDDWQPSAATSHFQPRAQDEDDVDSNSGSDSDRARKRPSRPPPNRRFPELHQRIETEIQQLGGKVVPKLNWSAPKDATWIMMDKTMACTSANDVYLLLKSSNFASHDLEHAFDGCIPPRQPQPSTVASPPAATLGFTPVLVLRPYFALQTALEFRGFVKLRNLVAISQRDLNHHPFLHDMRPAVVSRIKELFDTVLRLTFPDDSFTFDVYLPEGVSSRDGLSRARLVDINPWAPRTDSLLFHWEELLDVPVPRPMLGTLREDEFQRQASGPQGDIIVATDTDTDADEGGDADSDDDDFELELRLVARDDPLASSRSSAYSAHKLPKEVVDASMAGGDVLREFTNRWGQMLGRGSSN